MKFWSIIIGALVLGMTASFAADPSLTFTTDAPGNNSSAIYVKKYNAADIYPGLITVTVADNGMLAALGLSTSYTGTDVIFKSVTTADATPGTDTYANAVTTQNLRWGTELFYVSHSGSSYTLQIKDSTGGTDGYYYYVVLRNGSSWGGNVVFSNKAYMMNRTPTAPTVTAPVSSSTQSNYVGRGDYSITATGNYVDINISGAPITSASVKDVYRVDYYATNSTTESDYKSGNLLGSATLSSTTATASANFMSSGNRKSYIAPVAFDLAGNQKWGTAAGNFLDTKWLTLGRFGDSASNSWLGGDSSYAHGWQSGNTIVAGNTVTVDYYATDFFGTKDATFTSTDNVMYAAATVSTSNLPMQGYLSSGNTPFIGVASGNGTLSGLSGGNVMYSSNITLYRQQAVSLGANHVGSLWPKDSPLINVVHNKVDDVVFTYGGYSGNTVVHSDGKGITSKMTTFSSNAIAGTNYAIQLAAVDQYWNICLNETGSGNTVALSDDSNATFSTNAVIHGYDPYNASAKSYVKNVSGNFSWSTSATSGLMTLASNVMLYKVETSGNLKITTNFSSDNLYNNSLNLKVSHAASKVAYFDNDGTITNGQSFSGNYFTAGGANVIYAHITDEYGNLYSADTASVTIASRTTQTGNSYTIKAYRNDASTLAGTSTKSSTATGGVATFTDVRLDKATTAGNTTYFPYTSFGIFATFSGNTSAQSYSPALGVSGNGSDYLYFATAGGEPIASSNTLYSTGNTTAGTNIEVYAAITDLYGNVSLTSTDTVGLSSGNLSAAPDGTTVVTSGNSVAATTGTTSVLKTTPVKKESPVYVSLTSGAKTGERSQWFGVKAGAVTQINFVDSTGLYSATSNIMSNTAGNTATVYYGALDRYKNTNTDTSSGTVTLTSSSADTSPAGNAAVGLGSSSAQTFSSGKTAHSLTFFDAKSVVSVTATYGSITNTSGNFAISANTAKKLAFVNSSSLTNDAFTSSSGNIYASGNYPMSSAIAGNTISLIGAVMDDYGNIVTTATNVLSLADAGSTITTTLANTSSTASTNLNVVTGTAANGFATLGANLLVAQNGARLSLTASGLTGLSSANTTSAFAVIPNAISLARFATSSGNWVASMTDATSESSDGSPIPNPGVSNAMNGVYVGFYDVYGNMMNSGNSLTGSVNLFIASGNAGADNSLTNASANLTSPVVGISGNLSGNNLVYFDPDVSAKAVTIGTAGNYTLGINYSTSAVSGSGNSNLFKAKDTTPPVVTVVYPNGGELLYNGVWNLSWTVTDTNYSGVGTFVVDVSYDGGTTWSSANIASGTTGALTATWTIGSNVSTFLGKIRVRCTDQAGNIGEDISDAVFTISPSSKVINYVVGDVVNAGETSGNKARVEFRQPVYGIGGASLVSNAFDFTQTTLKTGLSSSHSAGATYADLTFASNLISGNLNSGNVSLGSGNAFKSSNGSGVFTSSELTGRPIRQIVAQALSSANTMMTSSSNQRMFGLKLVGWTNNTTMTKLSLKLNQVGGLVASSDFGTGSNTSVTSGLSLINASTGNVVTLTSTPTINVGSTTELMMNETLGTSILSGSANYNYYVSVATSSTISDTVPDSFNLAIEGVTIADSSTATNIIYKPYGSLASEAVVADVTAPAAPVLTFTSNVISSTLSSNVVSMSIKGEASSDAFYTFMGSSNISGNVVLDSSGSANIIQDLTALNDGVITVKTYLVDALGNSGSGSKESTDYITLDKTPISSSSLSLALSNITIDNEKAVSLTLGANETGGSYVIKIYDVGGNLISTLNGVMGSSNTVTLTGLDFSSIVPGAVSANVVMTDSRGNVGAEASIKTVTRTWNTPVLSYVVGDVDSSNVIAVFDRPVYSNTNDTGVLTESNFTSTGFGGVSLVTHSTGGNVVSMTLAQPLTSNSNLTGVNAGNVAPANVYAQGGYIAATTPVVINQIAAADNVTSSTVLSYSESASATTLGSLRLRGWSTANVSLKGFNYTVVPVNGTVTSSDFAAGGNLSVAGITAASVTGSFGSSQSLSLTTAVALSANTSSDFALQLTAGNSVSSPIDVAKAVKLNVTGVILDIDGTVVTRKVAGTTTTSAVQLTDVNLPSSMITSSSSDANLHLTVGQTVTISANNVSDSASFQWSQISGNAMTILNGATKAMSFVATEAGQFGFALTYTLSGYSTTLSTSANITVLTTEQSAALATATIETVATQAALDTAVTSVALYDGGVAGNENYLVNSASNLVLQAAASSTFKLTSTQVSNLLSVVDQSSPVTTNTSDAMNLLNATKNLSVALDTTQVQQAFRILKNVESKITSASDFNTVVENLAVTALKGMASSGEKNITIDMSPAVKASVSRLDDGLINTVGISSVLNVSMSSDALASIKANNAAFAAAGVTPAIYAANVIPASLATESSSTVPTRLASRAFEVKVFGVDASGASVPASVSGLTSKLEFSMSFDSKLTSGNTPVVRYYNGSAWVKDADIEASFNESTGKATFKTPHLTQFAVFADDGAATTTAGGGGGGGCLLR
jgi:hypothetical protein